MKSVTKLELISTIVLGSTLACVSLAIANTGKLVFAGMAGLIVGSCLSSHSGGSQRVYYNHHCYQKFHYTHEINACIDAYNEGVQAAQHKRTREIRKESYSEGYYSVPPYGAR
jgi:fructose-1,6-bisphosphatase/inositol monophosphatase family enzyme